MSNLNSSWSWLPGHNLEVNEPTIFSIHSQERLDAFQGLDLITLRSKMVVILHSDKFTLTFPKLSVPEGVSNALLSFSGEGTVVWKNPSSASPSISLTASVGIKFKAHDMDLFKNTFINGAGFEALADITLTGNMQMGIQPPSPEQVKKELLQTVRGSRFALLCGAGVSIAMCKDSKTWSGFVNEYAEVAQIVIGTNAQWLNHIQAEPNLLARVTNIANFINSNANLYAPTAVGTLEIHRLVAQMIFNRQNVNDTFPARVLHSFKSLILTTNYDTLLEKAISSVSAFGEDRVTMSHNEYMTIENPPSFNAAWGVGPFFSQPRRKLVVHVHGRYFDVGREHGFCLTQDEYENKDALISFLRFMIPWAKRNSLVFVGANGTWLDLHFQSLWMNLAGSQIPHFVLCSDTDYEHLYHNACGLNTLHGLNIIVVRFYNVDSVVKDPILRHAGLYTQLNQLRILAGL